MKVEQTADCMDKPTAFANDRVQKWKIMKRNAAAKA